MTLEEAIKHLEESLADPGHDWGCEECKGEHEQLLKWLQHYQRLTETGIQDNGDKIPGYSYTYITDIMGVPHIHINSVRSMLEKAVEEHEKLLRSAEGHIKFLLDCAIEPSSIRHTTEKLLKEMKEVTNDA